MDVLKQFGVMCSLRSMSNFGGSMLENHVRNVQNTSVEKRGASEARLGRVSMEWHMEHME